VGDHVGIPGVVLMLVLPSKHQRITEEGLASSVAY
jgi:hypothetical protein